LSISTPWLPASIVIITIISFLTSILLPLQVGKEAVSKRLTWVIETQLLVHSLNLLHILSRELEVALEVLGDAIWRLGFREDGVAACDAPCEGDLATGLVVLLADFDEDWVVLFSVSWFVTVCLPLGFGLGG
jgi:hypothetical protein